jgi:Protein of unknown function (DUF1566)
MPETSLEWSLTLGGGKRMSYADAQKAISALGPEWRFPSVQELLSIVDYSRCNPAIDIERFPDTKSGAYWTSTDAAWDSDPNPASRAAWIVDFLNGYSVGYGRYYGYAFVRACRPLSSGQ